MANCRACNREIVWATNPVTGKKVPLDASPVVTYQLQDGSDGKEAIMDEEKSYISHFLTCPSADRFSKGKKK